MDDNTCAVYMMTDPTNSVLYIGMTTDLPARILSHKQKIVKGFTKKYNCTKFVYYEVAPDRDAALAREKELKGWSRVKKTAIVLLKNPTWKDLSEEIGLAL